LTKDIREAVKLKDFHKASNLEGQIESLEWFMREVKFVISKLKKKKE